MCDDDNNDDDDDDDDDDGFYDDYDYGDYDDGDDDDNDNDDDDGFYDSSCLLFSPLFGRLRATFLQILLLISAKISQFLSFYCKMLVARML